MSNAPAYDSVTGTNTNSITVRFADIVLRYVQVVIHTRGTGKVSRYVNDGLDVRTVPDAAATLLVRESHKTTAIAAWMI